MAEINKIDVVHKLLEAYGVGVRAGVLTPCSEDEAAFRVMLGLPALPPSVAADWADSDGIRRPITLQRPDATEGPDPLLIAAESAAEAKETEETQK